MFDQKKQECTLFSEHIEYGSGRLYDENNKNLVTIRLDKDSLQDQHQMIKNSKNKPSIISSTDQTKKENTKCDNCEL